MGCLLDQLLPVALGPYYQMIVIFPGVSTAHRFYLDDALIHNSSELGCLAYGVDPGSLHTFQLQACMAKGCALGPLVSV